MKNIYLFITVFVVLLTSISQYGYAARFPDIAGHQYEASIEYLAANEIIKGYPDGTFGPNNSITRAELLKIILEGLVGERLEEQDRLDCFPDIIDQWHAKYVCYAYDHNIVKGYPDGTFGPDNPVTVAEALKISLETFDQPVNEGSGNNWYQPYLDYVHKTSLFSKYSLIPDGKMTRGRVSYLIHQLLRDREGDKVLTSSHESASMGCGETPPNIPPSQSIVNGDIRPYITDIGKNYDKDEPTKLIFAFHGRTNPNTMVRKYYKIQQASKGDAIIVYPSGWPTEGPTRTRSSPGDPSDNLRDFALFDQLVDEFSKNYCIDMDQIYVVGHSLGAWFTNSLACARGDMIRGIGSVGGGTTINECTGPVAAMIMHNPDDRLSGFSSGRTARDQLLRQNGCGPETVPTGPEGGNCVEYINCTEGAPVIWCPHSDSYEGSRYYPHTWPNFAGETIWEFFEEQE